jgi:hypothetical protein
VRDKRVIWKYPFEVKDNFSIDMPYDAKILHVNTQYDKPCIWAELDRAQETNLRTRNFRLFGTGHERIEGDLKYIGTFQMYGGKLVFHLYEEE